MSYSYEQCRNLCTPHFLLSLFFFFFFGGGDDGVATLGHLIAYVIESLKAS